MADELNRILDDLRDELRDLSRVLQSTFKIFDKGNNTEKQHQQNMLRQRRQLLDVLKKEGVIKEDQYKQGIKVIEQQSKNTTALKKATAATKEFGAAMAETGKNILKDLAKGVVETGKNFSFADRKIEGFADATKGFDDLKLKIPGLELSLSDFGRVADFNVGIFKQLSQTGAGFGKSVIQLRNAATSANMPILDFVDLIQTNSTTFSRLFGTIMDGMPTIQGFTRSLRERTRNELAEFGLNLDETSEFLVTQLEIQRARGNADRVSQMDLVSRTVEYAKNLTRLSKLTGIQVTELDKTNRQLAVEGTFQASLMQLNQKGRDATTAATTAMENLSPELALVIKDITQFGVATLPVSRAFQVGSPQIIEFIKQLNEGTLSSADFVSKVKGASNTIGTDFAKSFADAGRFGLEGAEEYLNAITKLAGSGDNTLDKQMNVQGDNTKLLVGFGETIDTLKTQAETLSTGVFGKILNSETLGKVLEKISGTVSDMVDGDTLFNKAYDASKNAIRVTSAFFSNLGTTEGTGRGTILSTAEDSMFGMARRAGERFGEGGQGNSLIDILTPWDTLSEKLAKQANIGGSFQQGTDGFRNFGSGTPATLHGIEAVVPKNDFGQLAKVIAEMTGTTTTGAPAVAGTGTMNAERYLSELVELNKNTQRALNTLVTIGAMTEKNTKNFNNNLANMGGSLV
jgi:uncharacterized protein YukE